MADGHDASNALTAVAIESCLGGCSSSYAGEFVIELATKELKFFSARALVRNAITKLAVGGDNERRETGLRKPEHFTAVRLLCQGCVEGLRGRSAC